MAGIKWRLTGDGFFADLEYIEQGFEGVYEMSTHPFVNESGQVDYFDDGVAYDKVSSTFTAVIEEGQLRALTTTYNNNRDGEFVLSPVNGGSGLALFTPAYAGDSSFIFKIAEIKQTGTLDNERYQWFRVQFKVFSSTSLPAYSPSLGNDEGNIQIGTIGGLRYPLGGFSVSVDYDVGAVQTGLNIAYVNNWYSQNEKTKFKLRLLQDKMSLLLKHLIANRNTDYSFVVPNGVFPFGATAGDNQTFTAKLLTNKLKVKQVENKRYDIDLEFQRVI